MSIRHNGKIISGGGSDGNWTFSTKILASGVSFPVATSGVGTIYTYDISDYLPNDDNIYEIIISGEMSNSSSCTMYYFLPNQHTLTLSKGDSPNGASVLTLVDVSRVIKIGIVSTEPGIFWLNVGAYRKVR